MASSSTPAAVREMQKDLEVQANALSKIQKDISKNHQVRKQYTIQVGENELVLKELELLDDGANVYKLIGPVLVKQDLAEAKANVKKRIEYISAELKRMDRALKDLEDKQNSKKESVWLWETKEQIHHLKKKNPFQWPAVGIDPRVWTPSRKSWRSAVSIACPFGLQPRVHLIWRLLTSHKIIPLFYMAYMSPFHDEHRWARSLSPHGLQNHFDPKLIL
ncbi:unnamed protein product [Urochloa decumbens]|uniref:Prefoldin subunit 6 n=1 Tax=Urochloa decumbens TaxID=240449 RepID=A0ABC9CMT3_9POAL